VCVCVCMGTDILGRCVDIGMELTVHAWIYIYIYIYTHTHTHAHRHTVSPVLRLKF
jgi:hypothetical protein